MANKFLCVLLLTCLCLSLSAQNQILVNIVNQQQFGTPNTYDWGASALDSSENYYTVGHTNVDSSGASLLLVKQNTSGESEWQQTFTPSLGTNCYGIGLTFDSNDNIYVIGASKDSTGGFNFVVIKYSSTGTKLWHKVLTGTINGDDIPTDIACNSSGSQIFLTGARSGSGGLYDYWTHCLNGSDGSTVWSTVYDYAGLHDAPAALKLDSLGNPIVMGVSADSELNWELATVKYDASDGQLLSENRVSNSGIGIYLPSGLDLDSDGNMYVTGTTASSLTDFDIKTVKINSDFSLGWQKSFDAPSSLDSATQIKVTAEGEVYVSGFYKRDQQGIEGVLLKYNTSGDLEWAKVRTNSTTTSQCRPLQLALDLAGNAFVAYEITDGELVNNAIVQYDASGTIKWERTTNRVNGRNLPLNISIDTTGRIYITSLRKDNLAGNKYRTFRMDPLSRPLEPVVPDSTHFAGEILIRFASGLTNSSFIDNRNLRYGTVAQVLSDSNVINEIDLKIAADNFEDWTLVKVHPNRTTADSVKYTPEGRKIIVPDYYNTFLLLIPRDYDRIQGEMSLADTLKSSELSSYIWAAELNFIITPDACDPDDPIYANQGNLRPTSEYANGHINIEEAWCIAGAGSSEIKVAIIDTGVRFTHEDFNEASPSGSVVVGGRIYATGADLLTNPNNDLTNHGTRVASIVGSIRNNDIGVAGIAGGNSNADGVKLVGLNALLPQVGVSGLIQAFADAVDEFGVNVINCSGGYNEINGSGHALLREQVQHAHRMGVVVCASRGNSMSLVTIDETPRLPGTIQDEWVICVGGTNEDGFWNNQCRVGVPIDIAAPSRWELVRTAQACSGDPCTQSDQAYGGMSFTSAATPHATGVAALMMSYYNAIPGQTKLTHDDVEYILKTSAKDVIVDPASEEYDIYTGHGLLDAGAALKMIERPRCNVFHFGTDVSSHTRVTELIESNIDLFLASNYTTETGQFFLGGSYKADVWKVTATVSHSLPGGFNVEHFWSRNSACTTFDSYSSIPLLNNFLLPVDKATIIGTPTNSSAVVTGYVYLLKDDNNVEQGWIPASKDDARLTYSLIGCDPTVATTEEWPESFRIFPNPAYEVLNIDPVGLQIPPGTILQIMDISGRNIKTLNLSSHNELQTIYIGDLPQGIYLCHVLMNGKIFSTKFVKI